MKYPLFCLYVFVLPQMTELEQVIYVCKHWFSNYSLVYIFYIVSKSYKPKVLYITF